MRAFLLASLLIPTALAHGHPPGPDDARTEFRQLLKDYGQAQREFRAELEAFRASEDGQDPGELAAFEAEWNPAHAFVELFAEAAESHAGTPDAVMFLDWVVVNAPLEGESLSAPADRALQTLMEDHRDDPAVLQNIANLGRLARMHGTTKVEAILARVEAGSLPEFTLAAAFARGVAYAGNGSPGPEEGKIACASFKKVLELDPEGPYAATARGFIFELENLQVGMIAPDIVGKDLDGVAFKLSDYRGKVVFLDFWGDW